MPSMSSLFLHIYYIYIYIHEFVICTSCFDYDNVVFVCMQLRLLCWKERPLLNVAQTNLLLNKLQDLSIARLRPDFIEASLPPQALSSVRLALATNLGRAILEE